MVNQFNSVDDERKHEKNESRKRGYTSMFVSFESDKLQPKADQPQTAKATQQSQCYI
jgi:hypothetical protein